jgi:hypothetical protein
VAEVPLRCIPMTKMHGVGTSVIVASIERHAADFPGRCGVEAHHTERCGVVAGDVDELSSRRAF